jgi:hypothetical protein
MKVNKISLNFFERFGGPLFRGENWRPRRSFPKSMENKSGRR